MFVSGFSKGFNGIETINPVVSQSTDFNVAVIVRETM